MSECGTLVHNIVMAQASRLAVTNIEHACNLAHGFARVAAAQGFLLLVPCKLRRSPHVNAHNIRLSTLRIAQHAVPNFTSADFVTGLLARAAFARAGADQVVLEFGEPAQYGEHQAPVGRRRIRPYVVQRTKPSAFFRDLRQRVQQVTGRARQSRSSRVTSNTSPPAIMARTRRNCARSVFVPLAASRNPCSAPAARKAFTCASTLWPFSRDSRIAIDHHSPDDSRRAMLSTKRVAISIACSASAMLTPTSWPMA